MTMSRWQSGYNEMDELAEKCECARERRMIYMDNLSKVFLS